jgi:hypothetical protein
MDRYNVVSGEFSKVIYATTPREAAEKAMGEAPVGVRLGVLVVVEGLDGETFFATQIFFRRKVGNA